MYNRYVPQPDGSFRRSRMDDPRHNPPPKPNPPCCEETPCCEFTEEPPCPPPREEKTRPPRCTAQQESIGGFLQNLLPKNLDTGDLIVILLLLLLAGDCEEDRSNALLTLALYLFM